MAATVSRSLVKLFSRNEVTSTSVIPKRLSSMESWVYRRPPLDPPKFHVFVGQALNAFAWWWILTHIWYQPGHILGEFPYPNRKAWTDEELGVALPDEEEMEE